VRFHPRLPAEWERLRFRVQVREQLIEVDMTHTETTYRLLEGRGIVIQHFGEQLRLSPGAPLRRPERPHPARTELHDLPRAA
jgi:alpha,alpha-trehalose phosphorylase